MKNSLINLLDEYELSRQIISQWLDNNEAGKRKSSKWVLNNRSLVKIGNEENPVL